MTWRRALDGWVSGDGRWRVRKVQRVFWIYRDHQRFTPTGRFEDVLSYTSALAAKARCEEEDAR